MTSARRNTVTTEFDIFRPSTASPRLSRWVVAVLLVLPAPLILAGVIPMGGVSAVEDDLLYYLPQRAYFAQTIRQGQLPLWNPYVGMGTPFAADPQTGMWYPPTWLFVVLPPFAAYVLSLWLHFTLAGAGMYRLARELGRSRYAALFAGIAFELGGFLIAHRAHLTILESAAWLPWTVYAWNRFARTERLRSFALAVLTLALQLLVQHPQVSLITLTIVFLQLLVMHHLLLRLVWQFPLGVLLSAGIAAIQWMPTFAFYARCTRSESTFDIFIENSIWPQSFVLLFWPMIFGARTPNFYAVPWWGPSHWCEQAIYPSLIVIVLAMAALATWRRDRQVRCWIIIGAVCFFVALGQFNPLYPRLFRWPFFSSLRSPARWMFAFSLILPLLASTSLDRLISNDAATIRRTRWWLTKALPWLMLVSLVAALVLQRTGQIPFDEIVDTGVRLSPTQPAVFVPILLFGLTAGALLGLRSRPRLRAACVLIVLLADLASVAAFVDVDLTTYPGTQAIVQSPLADAIHASGDDASDRLWVPRPEADYRRPLEVLWPTTNLLHDIPTLHGYGPLATREYRALLHMRPWGSCDAALDLLCRPGLLQAMGARWIAARSQAERDVIRRARALPDQCPMDSLVPADQWRTVAGSEELRFPVSMTQPGLLRVELTVRARFIGSGTRFYVNLEDEAGRGLAPMRHFEPADVAFGPRRLRLHFAVDQPTGSGRLRIASFRGSGIDVSDMAVGWVTSDPDDGRQFKRSWGVGDVTVHELADPAPRISFARKTVTVDSITSAMDYLAVSGPSRELPTTGVVVSSAPLPQCSADARVTAVNATANRIEVAVDAPAGGFLIFRDSFDPGWHAAVDGQPAAILRTNVLHSGLSVPANARQIVLTFCPKRFRLGAGVSLVSLVLLGSLPRLLPRLRKLPRPPTTTPAGVA